MKSNAKTVISKQLKNINMEFKGTKGEWSFNSGMAIMCNKISIADVWVFDVGYDESQANAKLIAAAPDLLEALQPFADLLKQFDGVVGNRPTEGIIQAWHHNTYGESQLTVEMLQKAKQAIEKALK